MERNVFTNVTSMPHDTSGAVSINSAATKSIQKVDSSPSSLEMLPPDVCYTGKTL